MMPQNLSHQQPALHTKSACRPCSAALSSRGNKTRHEAQMHYLFVLLTAITSWTTSLPTIIGVDLVHNAFSPWRCRGRRLRILETDNNRSLQVVVDTNIRRTRTSVLPPWARPGRRGRCAHAHGSPLCGGWRYLLSARTTPCATSFSNPYQS